MDLEAAIEQFDATDANIRRLEQVWSEMQSLVPDGISFIGGSPEDRRYRELSFAHQEIADALPAISGYRITAYPLELNEIAQARLDAAEIGEVEMAVRLSEDLERPGEEIDRYRLLFGRARRQLVRSHASRVSDEITRLLSDLTSRLPSDMNEVRDDAWDRLVQAFNELERLAGSLVPRDQPWSDLRRHLHFAQGQDLHAIARIDWPAVGAGLRENLYSELEPLPIDADDLGDLAASAPHGRATTELDWTRLSAQGFERVIFNLIVDAPGYENPLWLTNTMAPDRGRDLSAERARGDALSGILRERLIIQARHWLTTSIGVEAVAAVVAQMELWEPPPVDVLVFATSGRFTTDAVGWIESHNLKGERPHIEMWPNSHLELLIASRPHIAATAGLRA